MCTAYRQAFWHTVVVTTRSLKTCISVNILELILAITVIYLSYVWASNNKLRQEITKPTFLRRFSINRDTGIN